MAKRKTNTKAKKAAEEPTDDQTTSGTTAQTGGGDQPAPAQSTRVVADTPPTGGSDPSAVAAALTSGAQDDTKRTVNVGLANGGEIKGSAKQTRPIDVGGIGALNVPNVVQPEGMDQPGPANVQITVVGPKKGMRRAGMAFGPEPVTFPADQITVHQFGQLEAEPRLLIKIEELPTTDA